MALSVSLLRSCSSWSRPQVLLVVARGLSPVQHTTSQATWPIWPPGTGFSPVGLWHDLSLFGRASQVYSNPSERICPAFQAAYQARQKESVQRFKLGGAFLRYGLFWGTLSSHRTNLPSVYCLVPFSGTAFCLLGSRYGLFWRTLSSAQNESAKRLQLGAFSRYGLFLARTLATLVSCTRFRSVVRKTYTLDVLRTRFIHHRFRFLLAASAGWWLPICWSFLLCCLWTFVGVIQVVFGIFVYRYLHCGLNGYLLK